MPAKSARPKDKIDALHDQMRAFKALELVVQAAPDQQLSLTDPDGQSMPTGGWGGGMVGYDVEVAMCSIT